MTDDLPECRSVGPVGGETGDLSDPQGSRTEAGLLVSQSQSIFVGPLPPPEILRQYDEIVSGAAERILAMTEDEGKHRRSLESKVFTTESRNSLLGVIFAFLLGLCTIVGGTACILMGKEIGGTILGGAGLVGLVSVFVYGTRHGGKSGSERGSDG